MGDNLLALTMALCKDRPLKASVGSSPLRALPVWEIRAESECILAVSSMRHK